MNTDKEDMEIRRLFDHLKELERREVPSFHEVLGNGAKIREEHSWLYRYRLALAAVVLLILLTPVVFQTLVGPSQSTAELVSFQLADWEAPTDFLLESEDDTLLTTVPGFDLESSWWSEGSLSGQ